MTAALDRERFGPWALVTGASSGIGKEFVRQIAAAGINVVLVARREDALTEVGRTIANDFQVQFRTLALDLSQEGLVQRLAEGKGFDVGTVAEDIRQVIAAFGRAEEKVRVVGHDVGSAVAYAWAAGHPEQVEQLVLMEGLPAGLEPSGAGTPMFQGKPLWHLAFGMTPDVPERMLVDRERIFVEFLLRRGCYDPMTFPDEEIDAYTRPFAALGGVRGALAHIRAIPTSAALNRKLAEKVLEMPVLAIGAELSFGKYMAEGARRFARHVSGLVAERSGHWIPEERPDWLSERLLAFFNASLANQQVA